MGITDAVKIGLGMIGRDGVEQFTQQKIVEPTFVPCTCPLTDYAACMLIDRKLMHVALDARTKKHMPFTRHSKANRDR